MRPGREVLVPVVRQWVVLHRVGPDAAGALDSVRTDASGRYRFGYTPSGSDQAVYFASASYGGVAYFTPPFRSAAITGEAGEIVVYDTTSKAVPVTVRGRHLVISAPTAGDTRRVTEIFELSNDSSVARVSPSSGGAPVWTGVLPEAATDPRVAEGDVPEGGLEFSGGRVALVSPLPPGVKQLSYSYSLPATATALTIPMHAATQVFEVLIEDPSASASGARLEKVDAVSIGERLFQRYLGGDVPANAVAMVELPAAPHAFDRGYLALLTVVIGGAMAFTLARAFRRV